MNTKAIGLKLLVVVGLWMAAVPARALLIFDATNDFGTASNPNGAWSYGWSSNDFSGFTLYTVSGTNPTYGVPYWDTGGNGPNTWKNTHSEGLYGVPLGWLSEQPYANTQNGVLRWTAPESGAIAVVGEFRAGSGGGQLVWVRFNNNPWWSSGSDYGAFSLQTNVTAGSTVDFVVSGGDYFGATPITAKIELVPEPTTLGLLSLSAGLTALMRRRTRGA